jgi:hypothetical protein
VIPVVPAAIVPVTIPAVPAIGALLTAFPAVIIAPIIPVTVIAAVIPVPIIAIRVVGVVIVIIVVSANPHIAALRIIGAIVIMAVAPVRYRSADSQTDNARVAPSPITARLTASVARFIEPIMALVSFPLPDTASLRAKVGAVNAHGAEPMVNLSKGVCDVIVRNGEICRSPIDVRHIHRFSRLL